MSVLISLLFSSFLHSLAKRRLHPQTSLVSVCNHCSKPLLFQDKIPLLSYILLSGKCRFCKTKLSVMYFLAEVMGLLLGIFFHFYPVSLFYYLLTLSMFYNFWLDYYTQYLELSLFILSGIDALYNFHGSWVSVLYLVFLVGSSLSNKLGWGDTILMTAMIFRFGFHRFNWMVLGVSVFALLYMYLTKKDQESIAFGPFLILGYFCLLNIIP